MSQLPTITIADLLQYRVGTLIARIINIETFTAVSKFSKPVNQTVNVYKLTLSDRTGNIQYADWCKKAGVTRTYQINEVLRFAHAKLKVSTNIDPNTGIVYPPAITSEKGTMIDLMDKDMKSVIPRFGNAPPPQPVQAVALPPVASAPIPQAVNLLAGLVTSSPVPQGIPVAQSTPATEWMNVKAQYPNFYNAIDVLFGELFKYIPIAQQKIAEVQYSGLMDMIWGPK